MYWGTMASRNATHARVGWARHALWLVGCACLLLAAPAMAQDGAVEGGPPKAEAAEDEVVGQAEADVPPSAEGAPSTTEAAGPTADGAAPTNAPMTEAAARPPSGAAAAQPSEGASATAVVSTLTAEETTASSPAATGSKEAAPLWGLGRIELLATQTAMGFSLGGLICETAFVDTCSTRRFALSALLGAGLYGGTAFALTMGGIVEGQAAAIDAGSFWGTYLGVWAWTLTTGRAGSLGWLGASAAIGNALGLGAGVGLALGLRPDAGQVALVGSAMQWSALIALFIGAALPGEARAIGISQLVGAGVGLGSGIVASFFFKPSRARMRFIDLGAALGGGLAVLAAALTGGDAHFFSHLIVWEALLIPAGFATATALTHFFGVPGEVADKLAFLPAVRGAPGASVVVRW